jgi:hypothetical protein
MYLDKCKQQTKLTHTHPCTRDAKTSSSIQNQPPHPRVLLLWVEIVYQQIGIGIESENRIEQQLTVTVVPIVVVLLM